MNHHCPHGNRSCTPSEKCGPCSGTIVRDGEKVRAPLLFRDSVQRELAALSTKQHTSPGQATLDAMKTAGERTQAFTDHFLAKHAERQAGLTRNGYHLSLDGQAIDADSAGEQINEAAGTEAHQRAVANFKKRIRERQKHGYPISEYERSML